MFGSDSGANKFKKTYFNGFVDISGGDIILRDGSIVMSDTSVFKKNNFNLIIPTLTSNDYLVTSSLAALNYQTISGMNYYLTKALATSIYQPISLMSNYLTLSAAVLNYQTISGMNNYLTKSSASLIYQTISGLSNYLTKSEASLTYVSSSFATLDTPTITSGSASGLSISTSSFNGGVLNNAEIVGGTLDDAVLTNITANALTVNSGILNGGSLTDVVLHNSTSEENLYFTKKTSTTDNAIIWQEQNGYDVRGLINCDYFSSKMRFNLDSTYMPNGFEFQNGDVNILSGVLKLNGSNINTIYQPITTMTNYLTTSAANLTYQKISSMSSYLTTAVASSTYQPIANMTNYLTTTTASSTYQTIANMTNYLTTTTASLTYQTIANMINYAPLNNPTFTGQPLASTASIGTNTTQIATTAFVLANGGSGANCVNIPSYRETNTKQTIVYNIPSTIIKSNITSKIDNPPSFDQTYTFGKSVNNVWVAGGDAGSNTLAYSLDGINWIGLGTSIFSVSCKCIAWNGSYWVAGGEGSINTMAYSLDGINWIGTGKTNFSIRCCGIMWANDIWVAVGSGSKGSILYGMDATGGGSLTSVNTGATNLTQGNCVGFNGYVWIVGGSGTTPLLVSYDIYDWIEPTAATGSIYICNDIMWDGYIWIAMTTSGTNPKNNTIVYGGNTEFDWTGLGINTFNNAGQAICYNGSIYAGGGYGTPYGTKIPVAYSNDGKYWNQITAGTAVGFSVECCKIVWNGSFFCAVGAGNNNIAISYDGIYYKTTINGDSLFTTGRAIAFNNLRPNTIKFPSSKFVAVGDNKLSYSFNGKTYKNCISFNNSTTPFSVKGICIAYGDGIWIAGGEGTNKIAISKDGIYFQGYSSIFTTSCNGIAYNGSIWVAVGLGTVKVAYSTNGGLTWTNSTSGSSLLTGGLTVVWGNNMFMAGGQGTTNTIIYSYNGIDWFGNGNTFTECRGIVYAYSLNNINRWVAVGSGTNKIAYSNSGFSWTGVTSPFGTAGNSIFFNDFFYIFDFPNFVAVGEGTNSVAYSTNGYSWTVATNIFSTAGTGVYYGNNLWVATGKGTNTTAYSTNGITWTGGGTNFTNGYGIAFNNTTESKAIIKINSAITNCSSLDIVSDKYYNFGFTNASVSIKL
jgi:hypothetical protein